MIVCIDPGESSGWVFVHDNTICGGTIKHDRKGIWGLLQYLHPLIVVFEEFKLYPSHTRVLTWDTFYTCEIIGIVKLYGDMYKECKLIAYPASNKKYSGGSTKDKEWEYLKSLPGITNHTYDAYLHYCYWRRHK